MATNSPIEWTDATWNPVTGCDKISPGCKHCYAEKMANRLKLMGQRNYRNGFELTLQPQMLDLPLNWKSPKRIFVNSMSDLFHEKVAHRVDEDPLRAFPVERQVEHLWLERQLKPVPVVPLAHQLQPIGHFLRVTVFAPRTDLVAARHRVPCRVGPF